MAGSIKEKIKVMEHFDNGGEVEAYVVGEGSWMLVDTPCWNWGRSEYRIKEFQYPMWFKSKSTLTSLVVRFDSRNSGEVIVGNDVYKIGEYCDAWIEHTNKMHWIQVDEPREYPMWFKSTDSDLVVQFDSLKSGEVVVEDLLYVDKGYYASDWVPHTDREFWIQVDEPKPKPTRKATIEKWLVEENNITFVIETSDIDSWLKSFPTAKKLKLIESYEIKI